jgi:hypothetical protein
MNCFGIIVKAEPSNSDFHAPKISLLMDPFYPLISRDSWVEMMCHGWLFFFCFFCWCSVIAPILATTLHTFQRFVSEIIEIKTFFK